MKSRDIMGPVLALSLLVGMSLAANDISSLGTPQATNCYVAGAPVWVRFAYAGDKADWDASFGFDEKGLFPLVSMGNSAVFILSKGVGPFESRVTAERRIYRPWELLEAPRGKVVAPKNDKFGGAAAYNVQVNLPFDEVVDLGRYFEIDEPGVYTLIWGCKPNYVQELVFEIIP